MSPELEKKLLEKYPELYDYKSEDGKSSDISVYGFSHGDGWFNIIDCLSATIADIMKSHRSRNHLTQQEFEETVQVRVAQVKEKFGTLRFYYEPSSEDLRSQLDALVKEAEALSAITCEQTGQPGRLMRRGYVYKTLCDYYLDLGWEPALGEEKQ